MAQHHTRQGLDLEILETVALRQGKVTDLGLREFDVLDGGGRNAAHAIGDLIRRQPELRRRPAVEFRRELAHRCAAARGDVAQDRLYRIADLLGVFGFRCGAQAGFYAANHCVFPCFT
jgi:hypothetical protein